MSHPPFELSPDSGVVIILRSSESTASGSRLNARDCGAESDIGSHDVTHMLPMLAQPANMTKCPQGCSDVICNILASLIIEAASPSVP